jgi:3-phosphoshikimate 1-carboxyvinyltransferase
MSSVRTATVTPARRLQGRLRVPGDKSISHRYALLAALSEGRSELRNYAPGADCRSTLSCLAALGVAVSTSDDTITLMGRGLGFFRSPAGPLDAGNSGTTMRMLTGVLAGQPFDSTLVGDDSLSRRPMGRVIEPLSQMGAAIDTTQHGLDTPAIVSALKASGWCEPLLTSDPGHFSFGGCH